MSIIDVSDICQFVNENSFDKVRDFLEANDMCVKQNEDLYLLANNNNQYIKREELLLEKVGSKPSKEEEIKEEYTLLKNNGGKITIKVLKDLLQRLNIKSSGKKEELQDRIENLINA